MRYGHLSQNEKELKQAVIILSNNELALITAACEEYAKAHPRQKMIKTIIKELDDIAVY